MMQLSKGLIEGDILAAKQAIDYYEKEENRGIRAMIMNTELEKRIRKETEYKSFGTFFSNRDDDDFPEDPLGLLFEGNFEKGDKRLEIWEPFADMEPLELAELIENDIDSNMDFAKRVLRLAGNY